MCLHCEFRVGLYLWVGIKNLGKPLYCLIPQSELLKSMMKMCMIMLIYPIHVSHIGHSAQPIEK